MGCDTQTEAVFQTRSGTLFHYERDYWDHDDILIEDIAWGLSRVPRWLGQTERPLSVAQHSVHVYEDARRRGAPLEEQFVALMHDGPEFVLGDLPRPAKKILPDFTRLEATIWARISHKFFGRVIDIPEETRVKRSDFAVCRAEAEDCFKVPPRQTLLDECQERVEEEIVPWNDTFAFMRFMEAFYILTEALDITKEVE